MAWIEAQLQIWQPIKLSNINEWILIGMDGKDAKTTFISILQTNHAMAPPR